MARIRLSLLAGLGLLTGCPSPNQEGRSPVVHPGESNPLMAILVDRNVEREKEAPPPPVQTLYDCDFENAETNKLPDDFLLLDGAFGVREEGGNRFLELPGAPLDGFGVMFGPATASNVTVCVRIFGTNRGRRVPVFGVSLGGVGGLRLMVAPGKRAVELWRGDEILASTPYAWAGGKWTWMRLRIRSLDSEEWVAEGKAWEERTPEPFAWQVYHREKSELRPGRPAVWGSPISGTPIRFDDFKLTSP